MKKISLMLMAGLLVTATVALAAAKGPDDRALVAASFQQGEDADPAAPVTAHAAAPKLPKADPAPAAAPAEAQAQAPVQPAQAEANSGIDPKTIAILSQQALSMQGQVDHLRAQNDQLHHQAKTMQYTLYGLAALVILVAALSLAPRRNKQPTPVRTAASAASRLAKTMPVEDDTRGEYDFMGSSEGIPAKLDLARAYIAMEDYAAARETLAEILGTNHEEYRLEAKALLNQMNG